MMSPEGRGVPRRSKDAMGSSSSWRHGRDDASLSSLPTCHLFGCGAKLWVQHGVKHRNRKQDATAAHWHPQSLFRVSGTTLWFTVHAGGAATSTRGDGAAHSGVIRAIVVEGSLYLLRRLGQSMLGHSQPLMMRKKTSMVAVPIMTMIAIWRQNPS